ncbi:group 1 truncated hemoglobin [Porticoccaceae bacterium]|nr:group 1 truncated hemoglobin [Porticoccaceae bacterium]
MMDNLFDKYGGIDVMRELIKEFYAQVYAQPALKTYFEGTDLNDLIQHQCKFFAYAMGKPFQEYKDEWLKKGHEGRNISDDHFLKVAELLRNVLLDAGVENDDVKDIMIAVASKRPQIVNV